MFWLSAIAVLVIPVFGKLILSVFGSDYVAGYPVLVVLSGGYLARTLAGRVTAYLAVSGHHDYVLIVSGGAAVANVVLNVILIPWFGTMGAAVATVLAMLGSQAII